MTEPKRIDIAEFRELGFLQEANRLFFHPRGLALEVVTEKGGGMRLGGVWDYREDDEGILYGLPTIIDTNKVRLVKREYEKHEGARKSLLKNDHPIQLPGQELEP